MNIAALLPFVRLSDETAIDIFAVLAIFVVVIALYRAFAPSDKVSVRARTHAKRRNELRSTLLAPVRAARRQQQSVHVLRGILDRLKLNRGDELRKASEFLAQAGWRTPDAVTIFLSMRLAMPVGLGLLAYLVVPGLMKHLTPSTHGLVAAVGVAAGAFAPSFFVKNASQKRQNQILRALPDALDLFVICSEAGLGLDAAITRVAREIGPNAPELADELGLTAIELGFLPNRRDALINLSKRTDAQSVRALVNTLVQTERYGTPLAQSLRVLATEFRDNRMMKAEEKAARLPATLTVPMIIFILPPLFVVLIGPAIIQVVISFHK